MTRCSSRHRRPRRTGRVDCPTPPPAGGQTGGVPRRVVPVITAALGITAVALTVAVAVGATEATPLATPLAAAGQPDPRTSASWLIATTESRPVTTVAPAPATLPPTVPATVSPHPTSPPPAADVAGSSAPQGLASVCPGGRRHHARHTDPHVHHHSLHPEPDPRTSVDRPTPDQGHEHPYQPGVSGPVGCGVLRRRGHGHHSLGDDPGPSEGLTGRSPVARLARRGAVLGAGPGPLPAEALARWRRVRSAHACC